VGVSAGARVGISNQELVSMASKVSSVDVGETNDNDVKIASGSTEVKR
jgi:hypothetical protein